MSKDLSLYIAFFSPSIVMRFFDEVALPGGRDSYEISKDDGAYLLQSRFVNATENERIHHMTGMTMRTLVTVSMVRPGDVSIVAMVSSVAFRLAHQIRREFMLVDDLNRIILMRKGHDLIVNDGMEANYELDIYDLHFEVRQLLLLDI